MKVLIISDNVSLHTEISAINGARSLPFSVAAMQGESGASKAMPAELPDIVIFDASRIDIHAAGTLERFSVQYPQAVLVLLTADQSPDFLIRAMRAGVREVLTLPLDHKAFNAAIDRVAQKASASIRNGKVISFISCKGGSGATFLATNFAYGLATLAKKKVLLIDLNLHFGDAAMYVSDQKPIMTLSDVCMQIDRIDAAFLESCLLDVSPGFGILSASDDPTRSVDITPEHIDTILRLARNHYDFIVLDVGRQIDAVSIRALDSADIIFPVLQLAMPYIRDGRRLLNIFRSLGYPRDKTNLIVNRYENRGKLRLADLENALDKGARHTIPNNFEAVSDSVNQGIPILQLSRNSSVSKALIAMVDQTAKVSSKDDKGIFSRLFNRSVQAAT
jgi:pilus assembly protein CpaE